MVPDARALARRAAERIVDDAGGGGRARALRVALAGGSTPRATYEVLGASALAAALPWGADLLYFGDERAVAARPRGEQLPGGAGDALRRPSRGAGARAPDAGRRRRPRAAARDYGELLPDPLDLVLLGLGEDGHTASLFPGSPALAERSARVVVVTGPKPPNPGLTHHRRR